MLVDTVRKGEGYIMPERLEVQDIEDEKLKEQLRKIDWPISHGDITIKIRDGRFVLATIARTIKGD